MPSTHHRRAAATAAASLFLLMALLLSACGGSSKGSSSTAARGASAQRSGQFGARAASVRACLQKNGITLPKRAAGQRPGQGAPGEGGTPGRGPFGSGAAGGAQLPKGVTRAQLEAAFKKCGGATFRRGNRGLDSAAGRQRFAKFAECMRSNGVKLPTPNTSGSGPIFNTKGIDTNSAAFKAADAKCMKELRPRGGATGEGHPPAGDGAPAPGASDGPPSGTPPAGGPPSGQ